LVRSPENGHLSRKVGLLNRVQPRTTLWSDLIDLHGFLTRKRWKVGLRYFLVSCSKLRRIFQFLLLEEVLIVDGFHSPVGSLTIVILLFPFAGIGFGVQVGLRLGSASPQHISIGDPLKQPPVPLVELVLVLFRQLVELGQLLLAIFAVVRFRGAARRRDFFQQGRPPLKPHQLPLSRSQQQILERLHCVLSLDHSANV